MSAPLIGVPARRSPEAKGHRTAVVSGGRLYADAIQRAGGLPAYIPPTDDASLTIATVDRCDGLVLLGGGDVEPSRYGQTERARLHGVDPLLDEFEITALRRAMERDIPVLAICRGHQVLNVALGGSLIQHIENHEHHRDAVHHVNVVPGSLVARAMGTTTPLVHCFHHQAIDEVAPDLRVVATHGDGTIEAVEHASASWVVGVQWHPEDSAPEDGAQQRIFDELVNRARDRR